MFESLPISVAKVLPIQFYTPLGLGAPPADAGNLLSAVFEVQKLPNDASWLPPLAAGKYKISMRNQTTGSEWFVDVDSYGTARSGGKTQNAAEIAKELHSKAVSLGYTEIKIEQISSAQSDAMKNIAALSEWRSSPTGIFWGVVSTVGMGLLTYHGYKRNNGSIGWALCWGLLGGIIWPVTVPIAFAQGLGKPKIKSNPVDGPTRRVTMVRR